VGSVIDLFSGTSRVGHALKRSGFQVFANDHNAYAATLAQCYVQSDLDDHLIEAQALLDELSQIPGQPGFFTESFCVKSRFFQPHNGARVDAIRNEIQRLNLTPELKSIVLVSLMEAADRVDSTTGVQMAYLKKWAARSHKNLELRLPDLITRPQNGKCQAHQLDALDAADTLQADAAYLDPPYNQHKYLGNYHIWETLVLWDEPELYGIACKRTDCRTRKSPYNSKKHALHTFQSVIDRLNVRHLIVSFNNEGYISPSEMTSMLQSRGEVLMIERDFKRYVGAQIGIHNQAGKRVGKVSHLTNKELIYVVTQSPDQIDIPAHMLRPCSSSSTPTTK